MISVVNMIINYTCVRLNGLNQHKRTSALNWRTNGIIRGNIISLGYYRGLNSGGLWESGIVLPLPEVMSGINYSSVIKDLKISHRGILTWIQMLGGVCVHVCACFDGGFMWMSLNAQVVSVPIKKTNVSEESYAPSTALYEKAKPNLYVLLIYC